MELQVLDIPRRPEYGILYKQVAIARQQVKLNRSELLRKVGIKGSYDYVHGLELNEKNFLDNASFSVLLNVSIPLFHFGERSNKVRAAKAKMEQTRLQQQNLNAQILLELTQAATNLDEAILESEPGNPPCRPFRTAGGRDPTCQQKPVRSRAGNSVRPSGSPSTMATGIRNPSGCPFPTLPELCGLSESSRDFM